MTSKVNWQNMRQDLSKVNWVTVTMGSDIDGMYNSICDKIYEVSREHVPLRREPKIRKIPRDRRTLMRKRTKIIRKLRHERN